MFEIESRNPDEIILTTKKAEIKFNVTEETIDAKLEVGKIVGPGEFEIGDVAIRGIAVGTPSVKDDAAGVVGGRTIYDAVIGNTHIGIIGGVEDAKALDDLGMSDVLCTSSVRAVREIEPKVVIAMGNVDGMVTELKLTPRAEKKFKIKNREALPMALEVVALAS
ncbi:MAG: hypothetical protein NC548_63720 [Lachnospiraceae bacterium]|nr:hypothetical protein [Lachnospiraceae bacterium]